MVRILDDGGVRVLREMEAAARARLPADVADYVAAGAGEERTLADNEEAWRRLWLRPRHLTGVAEADPAVELLGARLAAPLLLAPMGALDRLHPGGAAEAAAGAAGAGAGFVLATRAGARPAAVRAAAGPGAVLWLQLYVAPDREVTGALLDEAREAGFTAVAFTIDLPVVGRRDRALRHGALAPPVGGWAPLRWDDLAWVRERSGLPVLVKGVLTAADAELALEAGAAGLVVSNHGARQLDGTVPSAVALPEVVGAARGRGPVLVDGGVREGADVVRALALGADAALVGRPLAWALAAGGADGVRRALDALRQDTALAMVLLGAATAAEVVRDHVRPRAW